MSEWSIHQSKGGSQATRAVLTPPVETHIPPVVRARHVSVGIDGTDILTDLSFHIESGRLVGLLGPNGSGKTTLLRCISGLVPAEGSLDVLGRAVNTWRPRELARRLAFVRQAVSLSFDFTVSELVLLGRSPHKRWLQDYADEDFSRMKRALDRVDLSGFYDRSVHTLSGGELQRVFLAQALIQEADVLLLDEPTAHLDVHYQFEFMEVVRELVSRGRTVVAVFHDLEIAARYADALIILDRGRIAAEGLPGDVLTTDLIAEVFRMQACLRTSSDGMLRIEYLGPVSQNGSNEPST